MHNADAAAKHTAKTAAQQAAMRSLTFGIEIETVGADRARLAAAIATELGGTARATGYSNSWAVDTDHGTWNIVPDGSLAGAANGEIVSPILKWENMDHMQRVIRAARSVGARADESCGIHVHIGCAGIEPAKIVNIAHTISKQETLIAHALGVSEARRARYCKPIDAAFIGRLKSARTISRDELNRAWYGSHVAVPRRYDSSRYHGLNLNSYFLRGTIEFRYFNGTMHAGKAKAYVQLCLALVARGMNVSRTNATPRAFKAETARYDMRVLLLHLAMIGDEFETARLHLSAHLAGHSSKKDNAAQGVGRGRRYAARPSAAPEAPEAE